MSGHRRIPRLKGSLAVRVGQSSHLFGLGLLIMWDFMQKIRLQNRKQDRSFMPLLRLKYHLRHRVKLLPKTSALEPSKSHGDHHTLIDLIPGLRLQNPTIIWSKATTLVSSQSTVLTLPSVTKHLMLKKPLSKEPFQRNNNIILNSNQSSRKIVLPSRVSFQIWRRWQSTSLSLKPSIAKALVLLPMRSTSKQVISVNIFFQFSQTLFFTTETLNFNSVAVVSSSFLGKDHLPFREKNHQMSIANLVLPDLMRT